ncbi:hypothetical protein SPRG_00129 [Saprolegnia parasitica CBS 223.65]|uniref:Uncharacterized protein n=1 Tax=Saprolegnia parasitica (strain CBS 223.65) TaxID=695850 RepID=A0A067D8F7_SAPPC|nr:hypothetical protein SPRG_00129 [Saprolegnia parasitica CBS 223.65]KDO35282.1 hypothetical protein SPRG_00129 [Saprolegnia parasitica CBS 223.65]|eukprot:XP_012193632.1 hypothetical protein SPRG_00129 [Saprolegnia parasitica CBS 223.65]
MATIRATRPVRKSAWFSDPATYPIIAILGSAAVLATFQGVRHLARSPDVTLDKEKRHNIFRRDEKACTDFRSHRVEWAHLQENPITRSGDFVEFRRRNTKEL